MKMKASRRSRWGVVTVCGVLLASMLAAVDLRAEAASPIQVSVGEAVSIPAEAVTKLAIAEPAIADVVPLSDKEISIIGKKVGTTTLTVVHSDGRPSEIYRIDVGNEVAGEMIRKMIGAPNITVRAIGDTLVLDGKVNDELEAQRAVQVAGAYKGQVVNLLEIIKPRQIKIRTRVAEVNTEAIKNIGFRWFGPNGEVQYALDYTGGGSILHGLVQPASSAGATPTIPNKLDIGADVILQLLLTKNYARLLSEPTLVTFSGKEASFLVGQEVPIVQQLPQSFTVEFKEVGVRMKIKPVADSENRINTTIHAEVSQVVGAGAFGIPIIGAKTADTTLQVNDGQTIVIGGLLENNINRDFLRKVPWLAEIPIFGFLFRHKESDHSQREVLFFMTPEVIKDVVADVGSAVRTPAMEEWNGKKANSRVLEVPNKHDDWGLHHPDGMGLPERRPKKAEAVEHEEHERREAKPVSKAPAPAKAPKAPPAPNAPPAAKAPPAPKASEAPAAEEPRKEPTTNFEPARPAGE